MVSLKNSLPLITDSRGTASDLDVAWLRTAINSAAMSAGYHGWWQSDDVVESISHYLRRDYVGSVIEVARLEQFVQSVLHDVGYGEIASCIPPAMRCPRISLLTSIGEPSLCDRAEFYDRLEERIRCLRGTNAVQIHFSDLRACVDRLSQLPAENQFTGEDTLGSVVCFVRETVVSLFRCREVWCTIS